MTHRRSDQRTCKTQTNDSRPAVLIHAVNYISVRLDILHLVEKLKIAYGTSWKSRRISWIRNGEDVGRYICKPSAWNFMP